MAKNFFSCLVLLFLFIFPLAAQEEKLLDKRKNNFAESLAQELQQMWKNSACMYELDPQEDFDFFSLACQGNFNDGEREKFLDTIYRHNLFLKNETTRIDKNDYFYLYKLDASFLSRPLFVKLYFRKAEKLWSLNMPTQELPLMALFVSGVENHEQLLRWQQLGIPLQYTVNPFLPNAKNLSEKIRAYHQGLWLDIPYESRPAAFTYTPALTVHQAMQSQGIEKYLQTTLIKIADVNGVICGRGNYFSQNTFVVRKLMQVLKEKNITLILDADGKNKISYATAEILQQKAYLLDITLHGNNIEANWQELLRQSKKRKNSFWVMEVSADDKAAYLFLAQKIKELADNVSPSYPFVRLPIVAKP